MDVSEREKLANELEKVAIEISETPSESIDFRKGYVSGLRGAACIVRDNHPKEEVGTE